MREPIEEQNEAIPFIHFFMGSEWQAFHLHAAESLLLVELHVPLGTLHPLACLPSSERYIDKY